MVGPRSRALAKQHYVHLGEASALTVQADLYNVTNYVLFSRIGTKLGSPNFGEPSSQANNPRAAQLSARIEF